MSIREAGERPNSSLGEHAGLRVLEQTPEFALFKGLHDFRYILGPVSRADEQCVRCFNHYQVVNANCGNKFPRTPKEIALRVESLALSGKDVFPRMFRKQFIDGRPGADITPTNVRGDYENIASFIGSGALGAGCFFEDGVVHGNIVEGGIDFL